MSLYEQLKQFDKLANPRGEKMYFVTNSKTEAIHCLRETYTMDEAWNMIQGTNKNIRLKTDDSRLLFIDMDSNDEQVTSDFFNSIKHLKYVLIKSETLGHFHVFFKYPEKSINFPYQIKKDIMIWDYYGNCYGVAISLGPTLPNGHNAREFVLLPNEVDQFLMEEIKE